MLPGGLATSGGKVYDYMAIPLDLLNFLKSLQASLLCTVGELAVGESLAVAVGVSDR